VQGEGFGDVFGGMIDEQIYDNVFWRMKKI